MDSRNLYDILDEFQINEEHLCYIKYSKPYDYREKFKGITRIIQKKFSPVTNHHYYIVGAYINNVFEKEKVCSSLEGAIKYIKESE